jgi:acyl carrier protein
MENPTPDEIFQQLQAFIKKNVVDESTAVDYDTPFQQLGIDSMAIIELVLFLERKFKITIPESELLPANFKTIRTLAECAFRNMKNPT